jgi:hypothetical protein
MFRMIHLKLKRKIKFKNTLMKKILLAVMIAIFTMTLISMPEGNAQAQSTYKIVGTDTTVNTDTTILYLYSNTLNTPSKVRSIQATVTRLSGTTGGYVLLQGTNDRIVWKDVNTDTLTISSLSSGSQSKIWTSDFQQSKGTQYAAYRLWFKSTGTQTSILIGTLLRRNDD